MIELTNPTQTNNNEAIEIQMIKIIQIISIRYTIRTQTTMPQLYNIKNRQLEIMWLEASTFSTTKKSRTTSVEVLKQENKFFKN